MKTIGLILAMLLVTTNAWATSSTRIGIADTIQNNTGGSVLTVPAIGSSFLSDTNSATVSGKSMAGNVNTFTLIPVGAIGNGSVLSGTNTGDISVTSFGASPSASGFSLTGQALTLEPADATHPGGLLAADWVTFNAKLTSSLTNGDIFVGNGSNVASPVAVSGDITISNAGVTTIGAKKVQASKLDSGAATSGYVATADGSGGVSYAAVPSAMPVLNGSQASPQLIDAVTGVVLSGLSYVNVAFIAGDAAPITVTSTPSITACTAAGQILYLIGEDATNTVTLQDQSALAGSALALNGNWIAGLNSMLNLMCDGNGIWVEFSRQ